MFPGPKLRFSPKSHVSVSDARDSMSNYPPSAKLSCLNRLQSFAERNQRVLAQCFARYVEFNLLSPLPPESPWFCGTDTHVCALSKRRRRMTLSCCSEYLCSRFRRQVEGRGGTCPELAEGSPPKADVARRAHLCAAFVAASTRVLPSRIMTILLRFRIASLEGEPFRGSDLQVRHKVTARSAFLCAGSLAASIRGCRFLRFKSSNEDDIDSRARYSGV